MSAVTGPNLRRLRHLSACDDGGPLRLAAMAIVDVDYEDSAPTACGDGDVHDRAGPVPFADRRLLTGRVVHPVSRERVLADAGTIAAARAPAARQGAVEGQHGPTGSRVDACP